MKKTVWISIIGLALLAVAADRPAVMPSVEKAAIEVEAMVRELPVKEKALQAKTYSGTIDVILDQRIADVNEVLVFAKTMEIKAKAVCQRLDLQPKNRDFVKTVIDRHAKLREKETQKQNVVFLDAVREVIDTDTLPVDDPNYVSRREAMLDLWAFCVEVCDPK